jgi:hypothetical protein
MIGDFGVKDVPAPITIMKNPGDGGVPFPFMKRPPDSSSR